MLWSFLLDEVVRFRSVSIVISLLEADVDRVGTELIVESCVSRRIRQSEGGGDMGSVCGNP